MPELPEVEAIRRDLAKIVLGRRVERVRIWTDQRSTRRLEVIVGAEIESLRRKGKYLIAGIESNELVIHLGMSGRLFAAEAVPSVKHLRWVLDLSGAQHLVFVDRRRFGRALVVPRGVYSALPTLCKLGPEPLSVAFDRREFARVTNSPRMAIKSRLLDQRVVAGLGNIYVDESLFLARLHPAQRGLNRAQAYRLHRCIRLVLERAIRARGTSFSLHRDGLMRGGSYLPWLQVFGRQGHDCYRCGAEIVKVRLGGRGTHYCPICQRLDY